MNIPDVSLLGLLSAMIEHLKKELGLDIVAIAKTAGSKSTHLQAVLASEKEVNPRALRKYIRNLENAYPKIYIEICKNKVGQAVDSLAETMDKTVDRAAEISMEMGGRLKKNVGEKLRKSTLAVSRNTCAILLDILDPDSDSSDDS